MLYTQSVVRRPQSVFYTDRNYTVIERNTIETFQAIWIEIHFRDKKNVIFGAVYRQHNSPNDFLSYFDSALETYSSNGKILYILGDFNIDLLKSETCSYSQSFLLSLQSCYLFPTIDKPTRVYNNSATLIDNIFTNNPVSGICSGNIVSDISDHYSQFCITPSEKDYFKRCKKKFRKVTIFAEGEFVKELSKIDLEACFAEPNNVDKIFSSLYRKINYIVNKVAPLKTLNKRSSKIISKPWITKGIRESIRIKNQLFLSGKKERYRYYRNKIVTLIRISKKTYYASFFEMNMKNTRKTWSAINSLIHNKRNNSKPISALKDHSADGQVTNDPSKLPSIINKFFANIGEDLAKMMPKGKVKFTEYMRHIDQLNSFYFIPVTASEIEEEITLVPNNMAYGLYSFPTSLLKISKHDIISKHLAKLMNLSIQSSRHPTKVKTSKFIPVYKTDDDTDPSNYRPISLINLQQEF